MVSKSAVWLSVAVLVASASAQALTLDEYLGKVRAQSYDAKRLDQTKRSGQLETREADTIFSPALFANVKATRDEALANPPLITYDRFETQQYDLGISQQFDFGLQTKLYYEVVHTSYVNSPLASQADLNFYDARPVLELDLPLWGGGLGRTARAQRDLIKAQGKFNKANATVDFTNLEINAEAAYWKMATAKAAYFVEQQALKSAQAVHDYVGKKFRMSLGENSDVIQAQAQVEARQLEMQQSENDARAAAQDFNAFLMVNSSEIPSDELPIDANVLIDLPVPTSRTGNRVDVAAAEQQTHVEQANATIDRERNKPTFEVYGAFGLNGRGDAVAPAFSNVPDAGRSTASAGLRFSMPLDISAQSDAREGARLRQLAAETAFQKKLFDQDKDWNDLARKIGESQRNLQLALSVERIQGQKLDLEKKRLREGRTTTYQVLLFEQDYWASQLNRLRTAEQILNLRAQLRSYATK